MSLRFQIAADEHSSEVSAFLDGIKQDLGIEHSIRGSERYLTASYFKAHGGLLLLVRQDGNLVGTVGFERFDQTTYELRSFYLTASLRSQGLGRLILEGILTMIGEIGGTHLQLETRSHLGISSALYHSLGFRPVLPWRPVSDPRCRFLKVAIQAPSATAQRA